MSETVSEISDVDDSRFVESCSLLHKPGLVPLLAVRRPTTYISPNSDVIENGQVFRKEEVMLGSLFKAVTHSALDV